ncbi:MAG TPA: hypothetical protein GXZ90_07405 [Clostridiales bacterium]|nr:hypothetical protein [Clostridiales bacterium]
MKKVKSMKKLKIYINKTLEEEKALVDERTGEILLKGNYYHDKMYPQIKGLLKGFNIVNVVYHINEEIIGPEHPMFNKLEFYEDY